MGDEHDWVRRLLAEAGHPDETMPPEVADRLDRVLDELSGSGADVAPRPAVEPGSPAADVVPMTRPRQRRWAGALLAAAAITVGGYSVAATGVLGGMGGDAESATAGDSSAGAALDEDTPPHAAEAAPGGAGSDDRATTGEGTGTATEEAVPALSSTSLRRDAARLVADDGRRASLRLQPGDEVQDLQGASAQASGSTACLPPPAGVLGREVAVTYDGAPATAVVRRTSRGRADVQLWACDSPARLARVVVPR